MLLLSYIFTIALSSFLLFFIQPLAAKELLPFFGGVPAVWNICMVFFQGMLLCGYLYAFVVSRYISNILQRVLQGVLVVLCLGLLPLLWNVGSSSVLASALQPASKVLWLLMAQLALPLFILSTTSSMLQYWFGQTKHVDAQDPYFLYSASNVGGLLALLTFPFMFEPLFGLQRLSLFWSMLFLLFAMGIFFCLYFAKQTTSVTQQPVVENKITTKQRLHWLLLSFAPCSLLLGVTQYITSDIMAAPLFWILPLTLYLLTFIIAFAKKPLISHAWMVREQSFFLIFPLIALAKNTLPINTIELILFPLLGFFVLSLVCQGELVATRPVKKYLPEFYLWIALGGFLGSVFNGLIAPLIFNGIYEYYIAFCLCVLLRPWPKGKSFWCESDFFVPISIAIILFANFYLEIIFANVSFFKWISLGIELSIITGIVIWHDRPFRFAASLALIFIYAQVMPAVTYGHLMLQSRDFFGVSRVYDNTVLNLHILLNGTTVHGLQLQTNPTNMGAAISYYAPMQTLAKLLHKDDPIAIAGLGSGTLSCLFKDDEVTFLEIDPAIVKIAQTPKFFSYLQACPARGGIILGDARLSMQALPQDHFKMIIIDVFSSDSIPVHLITREAIALYLQKLTPDGLLVFHISSRHVDLNPILNSLAREQHLRAFTNERNSKGFKNLQFESKWIALTRNKFVANQLLNELHWKIVASKPTTVWTDDYSNILKVLK